MWGECMNSSNSGEPAKAAEQEKPGKKLLVAFFAALALLVLGVAFFFGAQALSGLIGESSQSEPYMVVVTEGEALVYSGDSDPVRIEGDSYDEFVSLDGKTVGFSMNMVDTRHYSLVVYNGKDTLEVDEDVCSFRISDNGSKVIYLADEDTEDFTATLCSYDVSSKKIEVLAEDVFARKMPIISPDGKSIAYSTVFTADAFGTPESYMVNVIKDGGDAEELGKDIFPFAMSDKANYVYYTKNDGDRSLFVLKNGNEVKLGKLEGETFFFFNKDFSELLFTSNNATYMSIGGADAEKISSDSLAAIVPSSQTNIAYSFNDLFGQRVDVASLQDHVVMMASDTSCVIAYMNSSYEFSEIASIESEDNNTATYYLHKYYDGVKVSKDDKSLYFANGKGELLLYSDYRDLKTDPIKIAEDVDSLNISFDDSLVYFITGAEAKGSGVFVGTLNVMENKTGSTSKEIDKNVFLIRSSSFGDVYYVFEETVEAYGKYNVICEAFYSRDGMTFKSVAERAIFR